MELYQNEDEQVEAIKRWWDQHGRSVLTLIALGVALAFAGQAWVKYRDTRIQAASAQYEQMASQIEQKPEIAMDLGRAIVAEYPSSVYAAMAAMTMARISVEKGELEQASAHLSWVRDNAKQEEIMNTASLRLARVLLASGELSDAEMELAKVTGESYQAIVHELKGDILLARGERRAAYNAYAEALAGAEDGSRAQLVQMKLNDLSDVKE